jgi:hypothetical protein
VQRIAVACNGLEIANRWIARLLQLSVAPTDGPTDATGAASGSTSIVTRPVPVSNDTIADPDNLVFLGGSCGKTTWRKNIAIPFLEAASITYYNPQVRRYARLQGSRCGSTVALPAHEDTKNVLRTGPW